jgi:hypothetical protein
LPFITDNTWTPATYRLAHRAWEMNAPTTDGKLTTRKAVSAKKPKHAELSRKLRSLMTWRAMASGSDWTLMADNDNDEDDNGRKKKLNADCIIEVRPLISEIEHELNELQKDGKLELTTRRESKLNGGGAEVVVVSGEAVGRGKVLRQSKGKPDCITSIGRMQFSNGGQTEKALVRDAVGKVSTGDVRIPLGGLIKMGPYRLRDRFRAPRGAPVAANDNTLTVGWSLTATEHAVDFADPVADAQHREYVRKAVGRATARILDHALVAANFAEIGLRLGYDGKTAERRGKLALVAACEDLEKILAA